MKIGIIGTAGRQGYIHSLDAAKFYEMKQFCRGFICGIWNGISQSDSIRLVSGGAAWADHLAVELYNDGFVPDLTLYLPTEFLAESSMFYSETKEGNTMNFYHRQFSVKCFDSPTHSLEAIGQAIARGARVEYERGFFARNKCIAQDSNVILAFSFGEGPTIISGGTSDTLRQFIGYFHNPEATWFYNLSDKMVYSPVCF